MTDRLPGYMVPAAYVVLDALPLTPNGKLDRAALPTLMDVVVRSGEETPTTPEEVVLCEIVAAVLDVTRVTLTDHFFQLGGHSLGATRLAAQVRARLGRELPIRTIFEQPVIGDLARTLRTLPKAGTTLTRQSRPTSLPASFAQARLWFVQQLEGASPAYHIPVAMRLRGPLDVAALTAAIQDVQTRHEALRTRLVSGAAGPEQIVVSDDPMRHPLAVHMSTPSAFEADLAEATATGFDLATEGPLRTTLWQLGAEDYGLLLLLHHSGADGWSVPVLFGDLRLAYEARRRGQAPAWTPLPVQYADYTLWQRAILGRTDDPESPLTRQLAYWRATLAHLPLELTLPTDRPRPRTPTYAGGYRSRSRCHLRRMPSCTPSRGRTARHSSWCFRRRWRPGSPSRGRAPTSPWARRSPAAPKPRWIS